jgi:hypothetical protein
MGPGGRGGSDGVAKSARIEPLKDFFLKSDFFRKQKHFG